MICFFVTFSSSSSSRHYPAQARSTTVGEGIAVKFISLVGRLQIRPWLSVFLSELLEPLEAFLFNFVFRRPY